MKALPLAVLFALALGPVNAADGCGPGCHSTATGACVVDGWGTGARHVWNECPVTSRPRPPCGGSDYVWQPRMRACFPKTKDWL